MNCDECKWYNWYYDYCRKWNSEVDAREVHNCYEKIDTSISDVMKNMKIIVELELLSPYNLTQGEIEKDLRIAEGRIG